jgi:cholesterol transport system auxiliary component
MKRIRNQGQSTFFRLSKKRGLSLFFLALLGACGGAAAPDPRTFDLGLEAPAARLPALRVGSVRAVAPFESTDMQYRLAYRNAAEVAAYASSRWAATPAELFRKQLLRAGGDAPGKCVLDVEIQEFSQVFAAKEASEARIELRASLATTGRSLSRQFTVVEGNAGPEAMSGAAALARASNRAAGEIGAWAAAQSDCR